MGTLLYLDESILRGFARPRVDFGGPREVVGPEERSIREGILALE